MAIEAYKALVIRLPAQGYGTIEFGMSDERRDALITAGRRATQDYFDRISSRSLATPAFEEMPSLETVDRIATRILYP